jgi:hypothetical protein
MKELEIHGRKYQYEIFSDCNEYYGMTYETVFYQGTEIVSKRKYLLFGERITEEVPKFAFKVFFNIEDPSFTKSYVRANVERQAELFYRQEEIDRGEII